MHAQLATQQSARPGQSVWVRCKVDSWAEATLEPEVAVALVLLAGGAFAGIAVLLGLPILPAAFIGAGLAASGILALWVSLIVSWLRSRRSRTTVSGDDQV
jgi:hypothetical protein